MSEPLMCLSDVSGGYGRGFVVQDVSLAIEPAETVGIIGPNGSGKTTLLRLMTRGLKLGKGTVSLSGSSIWQMSAKDVARQIAVVSQRIDPVPIRVDEYVEMGRIPHASGWLLAGAGDARRIATHYLEMMKLGSLADARLDQISGGERQLVQIARALTQEPKILFLDEPTSHLDIRHQVQILDLIRTLNHELGICVIMVMHDLNLASEYCSRLVMLESGRIYRDGSPETVLTYQNIEAVYETAVVVEKNPLSHRPFVLLVTGEAMKKVEKQ